MNTSKKGFTLIELLIVIGILAVLATITVLVLNPAELFRQARDSQRISDLGSIKGALALYLTTVVSPDLQSDNGEAFTCGTNWGSDKAGVTNVTSSSGALAHDADFDVDGSGWVAVSLSSTTGGSPLPTLPRDPVDTGTTYYYTYACDNTNLTFELTANMESSRYATNGADDVETNDGGNATLRYEIGTDPGLNL